jgi:regulatory protein
MHVKFFVLGYQDEEKIGIYSRRDKPNHIYMMNSVIEHLKLESQKRKVPRKVTSKSLENAALYYLQRFSSSSENFRRVMIRRVKRSAQYHNTNFEEGAEIVDQLISRFVRIGLLDDLQFAQVRAASLRRRGLSERTIRAKLMERGFAVEVINESLELLKCDNEDPELTASIIFSRKRRLGPFREILDKRNEFREKDMAKLARAGFSYHIAQKVIRAETLEELEEMVENNIYGQYK